LQRSGSLKLIDLVTVTFDEKVMGGKFWAKLATCGLDKAHISHEIVHKHERLLTGGVWANIELVYNDSLGEDGAIRPFVIERLSPYLILLSGGQGGVPDLFGWKNRKDKPGLVLKFDLVAFDEVAGSNFKQESDKQMYKGYMEQGSFSRGDDKGTLTANGGIVFNGNMDGDVETTARVSHLFA